MSQRAHALPPADPVEELRAAASAEDDNGQPLYEPTDPARPIGHANPPRRPKGVAVHRPPRPSRLEVERRIAQAQLWVAQRLPLVRSLKMLVRTGESTTPKRSTDTSTSRVSAWFRN